MPRNFQSLAAQATLAGVAFKGPISFEDLRKADAAAYDSAINRAQSLLMAYDRRGSLGKTEKLQLGDALELMNEYQNQNNVTNIPSLNSTYLEELGFKKPGADMFPVNSRSNVIDDSFRAIREFLFGPLYKPDLPDTPIQNLNTTANPPNVEHTGGLFPSQKSKRRSQLSNDELRLAAVSGIVLADVAAPHPYRTNSSLLTFDDENRRQAFNLKVSSADGLFRSNIPLYGRALNRLAVVSGGFVNIADWARVVQILVDKGFTVNTHQIDLEIDRALDAAQNVGQDRQPSLIDINLPDLDSETSDFEIVGDNIFALQPAYFAAMFEELKVFQVVDKLVELFQNGILPVGRGTAGNLLFTHWKNAALRVSEAERRSFYARALGIPGGDDGGTPNRDFKELFVRFVSAVSTFVRQTTVDNLLRSNIPGAISQQQVRKAGRDLATNLSAHGYGMAYPMATELQTQINEVITILKNSEIQNAYGAKDMWQVVDQVAGLELGGARNSVKYRTMASAGATVFAWLAKKSKLLSAGVYTPILDIAALQNPPYQASKPTKDPSDFDLVGACDQWLAVTGTQEDSVEKMAEPVEAPLMPSRPIQIPSVARDMLESVGVPAMAYSAATGKPNGVSNWRYK